MAAIAVTVLKKGDNKEGNNDNSDSNIINNGVLSGISSDIVSMDAADETSMTDDLSYMKGSKKFKMVSELLKNNSTMSTTSSNKQNYNYTTPGTSVRNSSESASKSSARSSSHDEDSNHNQNGVSIIHVNNTTTSSGKDDKGDITGPAERKHFKAHSSNLKSQSNLVIVDDNGYDSITLVDEYDNDGLPDLSSYEKYDEEIRLIQSVWRGYVSRKDFYEMKEIQTYINGLVIKKALKAEVSRRQKGWNKLCFLIGFLILYIVMLYLQILHPRPQPYEVEDVLMSYMELITFEKNGQTYTLDDVVSSDDIYRYVDGMIDELYAPDPENDRWKSSVCRELVERGDCNFTEREIELCANITALSGYLGNANRIIFGAIVTQQKRTLIECDKNVLQSDPYDLANLDSRLCYGENTSVDVMHLPKSEVPSYLATLDLGVLNSDKYFPKCKWKSLYDTKWIDDTTANLCIAYTTINRNNQGRYGYSKVCFEISSGGTVYHTHQVASTLIYNANDQAGAIVLTVFVMLAALIRLIAAIRSRHGGPSRVMHLLSNLFYIGMTIFYLVLLSQFIEFTPHKMDISQLASDPMIFVNDIETIYDRVMMFRYYKLFSVIAVVILLFDLLHAMSFHPAIGIVSRTLELASRNLLHFFIVFITVTLVYSFAGLILLNTEHILQYHTFWDVINGLWFLAVSEYDDAEDVIENPNSPPVRRFVSFLYFWSFIFIVGLLLFNILLSIVVDAYISLQEEKSKSSASLGVRDSIILYFLILFHNYKYYWSHKTCKLCCKKKSGVKEPLTAERKIKIIIADYYKGATLKDVRRSLSELFTERIVRRLTSIMLTMNAEEKRNMQKRRLASYALKAGDLQLRSLELLEIIRDDQKKMAHESHKFYAAATSGEPMSHSYQTIRTGLKRKSSTEGILSQPSASSKE